MIKPEYKRTGVAVTEPTYRYFLFGDLNNWYSDMVIGDGLFCAYDNEVKLTTVMRSNLSSAALEKEGLFNLCLHEKKL